MNFNSIKVQLKRHIDLVFGVCMLNFNSIKVQLKPLFSKRRPFNISFQFHKGTIKTRMKQLSFAADNDFNSIKVQLKPLLRLHQEKGLEISIP